jgi:hypothetical protein
MGRGEDGEGGESVIFPYIMVEINAHACSTCRSLGCAVTGTQSQWDNKNFVGMHSFFLHARRRDACAASAQYGNATPSS